MNPSVSPKYPAPPTEGSSASNREGASPRSRLSRYNLLPAPVKFVYLTVPILTIILFILHWFSIPVFGHVLSGIVYYYLIYALLGLNIFIGLGATRKQGRKATPWYDYAMAIILFGIIIMFIANAREIDYHDWDVPPNGWVLGSAIILGLLAIEAGRRVGGWGYAALLLVGIIYPLVASHPWLANNLGGVFYGVAIPFKEVIGSFAFGSDGMLGTPGRLLGDTILGFFLFAGLVMGMGGGNFFMRLATSLMGKVRGGQAKAAVVASALFGTITGSPVANIAGTGSFTIPTMKEAGYEPEYAAAVEACASSGCDTVPPVLGGLVFLMVVMFGIDYADVILATLIPSSLFYLGLLVQVDGYAARHKLKPIPPENIPNWQQVLGEGWYYIAGLALLVFGMVYMRWGAITPIYAAGLVLFLKTLQGVVKIFAIGPVQQRPSLGTLLTNVLQQAEAGLVQTASLINYAAAIFLGMGFILVGLLKTGVAMGVTNWMVNAGGENLYLILFTCFVFSVVMGMGGLQRTAYILLAIIAVPALVGISATLPEFAAYGGIPLLGLNLFFLFYSTLGGITPPVALHCVVAASIADADPVKTTRISCRLGAVLFFIPFFFVMEPSLLLIYAPWYVTLFNLAQAAIGVWLLSSGLEGYLTGIGVLSRIERVLLFAGGFIIAFPQPIVLGIGI
ncbi:MAG: TRAP transporter fused permease subunit, partial [Dehalococcoidales bacterium]|nr:TRAP transporter fused permease subunit [Dehalococcoidales bacterium]